MLLTYEHYRYFYTSCYGEVKNDTSANMDYTMEFYRLCLFSKGGIEGQNLDKVIFFQAIGKDGIRKKKSGNYIDNFFFSLL